MARRAVINISFWLLLLGSAGNVVADEGRRLVLVVAADSTLPSLDRTEIRKTFIGITVVKDKQRIEPLINVSDALLYQVFLQKNVFMSARHYERLLLARVFRSGGQRPPRYSDHESLVGTLKARPGAITYMWAATVETTPGIKVLQELWRGSIH